MISRPSPDDLKPLHVPAQRSIRPAPRPDGCLGAVSGRRDRDRGGNGGTKLMKTKTDELRDKLLNALAGFDLNELPGMRLQPLPLDESTQEIIKESAVISALHEILIDVSYCRLGDRMRPSFDERTEAIRSRVASGEAKLTFGEAVETYLYAFSLRAIGRRRLTGVAAADRDHEIALGLWSLMDCGLPVTGWRNLRKETDGRMRGDRLVENERHECLAMAMAKATGIGESTIARAWREVGNRF